MSEDHSQRAGKDESDPAPDHHVLSAKFERLVSQSGERVTLGALSVWFGDSAFGALMLLLALIGMLPSIPGTSGFVGAAIGVIALQLIVGARSLWLPRGIAERSFPRTGLAKVLDRVSGPLRWIESWSSPRLLFLFSPLGRRAIGLLCLAMAVTLALPLPLLNFVPALSIAFCAFGLLQRDGIAVLFGLVTGGAAVVVVALLGWLTVWLAGAWA